jgi:hypothetical protein
MRLETINRDRFSHLALLQDEGLVSFGEDQEGALVEGTQRRHVPVAPHIHVGC